MSYLKLKKDGYHLTRNLLDPSAFGEWWKSEGKPLHYDMMLQTRARWFFGARRVRRRLYAAARRVFDPSAPFAAALETQLDELPAVVSAIGAAIRRRGYKDFYTTDESTAVIVIPRGIVRNDFEVRLVKCMSDSSDAAGFPGLARRVVRPLALEAEDLLFEQIEKRRDTIDPGDSALLLGVDRMFRWRIAGTDGHYYLALSADDVDLASRHGRKRFRADAEEVRRAHEAYLKEMGPARRTAATKPFQATGV